MDELINTDELIANPLIQPFSTPYDAFPFDKIENSHYLPALKEAIRQGKEEVEAIANNSAPATFDNTIAALDKSGALVDRVSTVLFNLNSAETSPELQRIVKEASPLLSEYSNDIRLNEKLFQRIKTIYDSRAQLSLDAESLTVLEKTYKGFARNGANLTGSDKDTLRDIDKRLSELSLTFNEHILEETNSFTLAITDEKDLAGLPDFVKEAAQMVAKEKGKEGWIITLHAPSYLPFMTYAENRELRKKLSLAYNSRGFHSDANDNQEIVKEIVQLRHKRANLLGYASHAAFVLEERMAGSPDKVYSFLDDLFEKAKEVATQQMDELTAYARTQGFSEERLQRWDYAFYAEKLKKERYSIDDETLKPYFKLENVIQGVFLIAEKLYDLHFTEVYDLPLYHTEVTTYRVTDAQDNLVALFYADFFPRESKRNGAWMTSFREQRILDGKDLRPHASIVCNFTKPTETKPSLLTFNEVTTLFHEFGHALHGMLSQCRYGSTSGTNVYWDFVELPSQIMENWCYEQEALALFARHYETNDPIPQELIDKIKDSSNFMEGYTTLRQLSFGMLDMAYHGKVQKITDVNQFEKEAIAKTSLFPDTEGINNSVAFSHIFAGGYSAGYYSYKWAEVLDADAFEYFQERGIFNTAVSHAFRDTILAKGGSEPPMTLYKRFRGKEPSPDALLRRSGLSSK